MNKDLFVAEICSEDFCVSAEGNSAEEARSKLIEEISHRITVEIKRHGVRFSTDDPDKVPAYVPNGCCVVTFSLHEHHCGDPIQVEYLAVPIGNKIRTPYGNEIIAAEGAAVTVLDDLGSFMHSLPRGSYSFRKGGWLPCVEMAWLADQQLLTARNPL